MRNVQYAKCFFISWISKRDWAFFLAEITDIFKFSNLPCKNDYSSPARLQVRYIGVWGFFLYAKFHYANKRKLACLLIEET